MSELHLRFFERLGLFVDFEIIDDLIMSDNNILRPIVGHAFEHIVSEIITDRLGGRIVDVGGDNDIDLIIIDGNNSEYTTQLKTLNSSTIREGVSFGVSLHKTHGNEKNPHNLYPFTWPCPYCTHSGGPFPNFLIIPHPTDGVLIIPKDQIPENKSFSGHFSDPAIFPWDSEWLNRWDLLGFPNHKGQDLQRGQIKPQKILTRTCERVNLTSDELINLWLMPENFRMIDMNLRGNLREPALKSFLLKHGIIPISPQEKYPKYDMIVNKIRVQVKGPSNSLTSKYNGTLGVEVMGSHGKGAIRRYSETDFDYLAIVIDPQYLPDYLPLDKTTYSFCFIPVWDLPLHYRNGFEWDEFDKLYDVAKFEFILAKDGNIYLAPSANYQAPANYEGIRRPSVIFRNNNTYVVNAIPDDFYD